MSTKLYVGNLPFQTTEADLQTLFESSGQVQSINVVRDRATGQARGFAFVEMSAASRAGNHGSRFVSAAPGSSLKVRALLFLPPIGAARRAASLWYTRRA